MVSDAPIRAVARALGKSAFVRTFASVASSSSTVRRVVIVRSGKRFLMHCTIATSDKRPSYSEERRLRLFRSRSIFGSSTTSSSWPIMNATDLGSGSHIIFRATLSL